MGHWIVVRLSMEVSDMKKFLINIAIFFAIVAVVDFSLGKVFHYIQSTAGGRTGAEYYVCEKADEDVIIMGSSRASHHYVPEIISEKLGMSCFNAGQDGNGIILQYGRWKMLSKRHAPKLLIYDINTDFDLLMNDNTRYIDRLKPFCSDKSVKDYVSSLFPMERFKTLSSMYCYNYKFIEMGFDCIKKGDYMATEGYLPLNGHIRSEVVERETDEKIDALELDVIKMFYLEQLVKEAKGLGTQIVFVVSPSWRGGGFIVDAFSPVRHIAEKYGIPFYEYIESGYCENPDLFEDSSHLNDKGAKEFTLDFTSHLSI